MRIVRTLAAAAAIALLGVASNQCLTRGYIYSQIGTLFSWSGSAQSWSGSNQEATYQDFKTYIKNNGACGGPGSLYLIDYGHATGCAVNSSAHSPIFANNTFANGSLASWTATKFTGQNSADQDGDSGWVLCPSPGDGSGCIGTLTQTVNLSGTASPTLSFYYKWISQTAGGSVDKYCKASGDVTYAIKVNGGAAQYLSAPASSTWAQASITPTGLVVGNNTIEIDVSTTDATAWYDPSCSTTEVFSAQPADLDNVVLQVTY